MERRVAIERTNESPKRQSSRVIERFSPAFDPRHNDHAAFERDVLEFEPHTIERPNVNNEPPDGNQPQPSVGVALKGHATNEQFQPIDVDVATSNDDQIRARRAAGLKTGAATTVMSTRQCTMTEHFFKENLKAQP